MIGIRLEARNCKIIVMAVLLAFSCFLTYYFHAVLELSTIFTHFFYIPIILACLWWKRNGLAVAIFLAAMLFFSLAIFRVDVSNVDNYIRAAMFIVIASVVAELSRKISIWQDMLRESEEFSYSLLNHSPNPIIAINPDTSIRYVNPALENLTGFSSADLIGRNASQYGLLPEKTLHKITKEPSKNRRVVWFEERFRKKNGEPFQTEITSIPVKKGNELDYHLVTWVDITERKRREKTQEPRLKGRAPEYKRKKE